MHLCPSLNEGQSLLHLEQSVCLSSAGSTCYHISFKGNFSDSWKLGKCSNETLLFIMSASLRAPCFRACGRSPFLFCNLFSNTSFSKQQLTLISAWNWLAPGPLISKKSKLCCCTDRCMFFSMFYGCSLGGGGLGVQIVWGGGEPHETLKAGKSWASAAGSSSVFSLKWNSLAGILEEPGVRVKWTVREVVVLLQKTKNRENL